MKRKILAAAIASACAMPAMAQMPDGLQIYGRVNVTAERITTDNSSNTAVQPNQSNYELVDNSSRIGIRYKKELVPGTSAIFQIESRVNWTDGGSTFSPAATAMPASRATRTAPSAWVAPSARCTTRPTTTSACTTTTPARRRTRCSAGTVVGNQGFMNNTLWYTSPKFGGVHHRLRVLAARRAARRPEHRPAAPHRPGRLLRRRPAARGAVVREYQERLRPRSRRGHPRRATPPRGPSAARTTSSSWCSGRCGKWPSAMSSAAAASTATTSASRRCSRSASTSCT